MMARQSYQECTQTKGIIKLSSDALFVDMHLPAITKLLIVSLFFLFVSNNEAQLGLCCTDFKKAFTAAIR